MDIKTTPPMIDSDFEFSYHGKNGGCPLTFCSAKDDGKLVMGGTRGLVGVFTPDTNNIVLMKSQQFENYNVMVVKKLKALETYYAFGTLKFGLHIAEINIKKSQINQQNTFLRGKSIRDIYEYSVGKLIVCVSSSNELWLVDYLAMTERRLVSTFGPPLTIRKIHDGFKKFDNLFLVREKDWLCIFNRKFKYYTRILKIPSYIY